MMERCPSCGGILGRDCFNPVECANITASIYNQDVDDLHRQIEILKHALTDNNIELPNLDKPIQDYDPNWMDDLTF